MERWIIRKRLYVLRGWMYELTIKKHLLRMFIVWKFHVLKGKRLFGKCQAIML